MDRLKQLLEFLTEIERHKIAYRPEHNRASKRFIDMGLRRRVSFWTLQRFDGCSIFVLGECLTVVSAVDSKWLLER